MHRIDINLQVSAYFKLLISIVVFGSLVIIFTLPANILLRLFLVISVSIYAVCVFYSNCLLKSNSAVKRLLFNEDGWHISCRNKQLHVELRGESTVTSWVSILRFQELNKRQKYTSVIFRDAMNQEEYRRLIVLLRTTRAYQAERTRKTRFV